MVRCVRGARPRRVQQRWGGGDPPTTPRALPVRPSSVGLKWGTTHRQVFRIGKYLIAPIFRRDECLPVSHRCVQHALVPSQRFPATWVRIWGKKTTPQNAAHISEHPALRSGAPAQQRAAGQDMLSAQMQRHSVYDAQESGQQFTLHLEGHSVSYPCPLAP